MPILRNGYVARESFWWHYPATWGRANATPVLPVLAAASGEGGTNGSAGSLGVLHGVYESGYHAVLGGN